MSFHQTPEQRDEAQKRFQERLAAFTEVNPQQGAFIQNMPQSYRRLFLDVFEEQKSKSKALKAKCLDCTNFQQKEITFCTAVSCPLHAFRPYQNQMAKDIIDDLI